MTQRWATGLLRGVPQPFYSNTQRETIVLSFFWSVVTIVIQRENCIQISMFKLDFRTSKVIHDRFVTRQIHGQNRL